MTSDKRFKETAERLGLLDHVRSLIRRLNEKLFGMRPSHLKLKLIDRVIGMNNITSFADLGGVWGVNGAYSFYLLEKHSIAVGYLVDNHFTNEVLRKAGSHPQLTLVKGDFCIESTLDKIPEVDLVLLFDVLLHQVKWEDVCAYCSKKATFIVIHNPQWLREESVRLLNLGKEEYFRVVPHSEKRGYYENLFTKEGDRDCPGVWQWGICDGDLITTLDKMDFRLVFSIDGERWGNRPFLNRGFIFQRK